MTEEENVFMFIPNLIGYARVILAIISFYFMPSSLPITVWCYAISGLLDAVDGHAARYFNQSSKFGAMLDQLTDRIGTSCLLITLSYFYPKYMFWFQLSLAIDISCHWIFLHTSLLQGKTSHKFIDMSDNFLMRIYYTNKPVLFIMCACNEGFYLSLYCLHFTSGPVIAGFGLFKLICYICAPIALLKTFISLVHGFVACKNLASIDIAEREALSKKE